MKKFITPILLLCSAFMFTFGQVDPGEISGQVKDSETEEPLAFANVFIESLGVGTTTNENGFYTIKPLDPGTYELKISYTGYQGVAFPGIELGPGQIKTINAKMVAGIFLDGGFTVTPVPDDLIELTEASVTTHITGDRARTMSVRGTSEIISALASTVYQADAGAPLSFRGSRSDATLYFVDGIKTRNDPGIPNGAIGYISVYSGHIPAKYGDATGGIVVITTRSYFDR